MKNERTTLRRFTTTSIEHHRVYRQLDVSTVAEELRDCSAIGQIAQGAALLIAGSRLNGSRPTSRPRSTSLKVMLYTHRCMALYILLNSESTLLLHSLPLRHA